MQRKIRMVNNTHNKSMFLYSSIFVTAFIVVAAPIVGNISNAFATFTPFSLQEEPTQDGEVGLPPAENNTAVTNVTSPPQTPEANLTTIPEPTEPELQVPTPSQVPADQQDQTGSSGAVEEAVRCPAPLRPGTPIVLKSGNGPIGSRDSLNLFSITGFSGPYNNQAFIVARPTAWAVPLTGTQYISSAANRDSPQSGDIWYKVDFTLPPGFTNPLLSIQVHADNQATIFLNGATNQIGQQTPQGSTANFRDPSEVYVTTPAQASLFKTGTNTLYIRITNLGGPTGLDYLANVGYCQQPPPPPPSGNICPSTNVQHWDKIVFSITQPGLAPSLGYPANSPLDIKVLDDPRSVADIKKKVLDFLRLPDNIDYRNAITIHDIEYAIVCAQVGSATGVDPAVNGTIGPPGVEEGLGSMVPGLPSNATITEEGPPPAPLESSAETQGEEQNGIEELQQQLLQ
jgi:hypothetical protein